ncbi:MAG: VPLPA-CTERM sorting domain-containing protein [Mangrovicoccus sp.]
MKRFIAAALTMISLATSASATTISDVTPVPGSGLAFSSAQYLLAGDELSGILPKPFFSYFGSFGTFVLAAPTNIGGPISSFSIGSIASTTPLLTADYVETAINGSTVTVLFDNVGGSDAASWGPFLLMTLGNGASGTDGQYTGSFFLAAATLSKIPLPAGILLLGGGLGGLALLRRKTA